MDSNALSNIISNSVQSTPENNNGGGVWIVNWLANAGLTLSPWWSTARDVQLRRFWKESDHLAGALYTMEAKMTAIPFTVIPENRSDKDQVRKAAQLTEVLQTTPDFGGGWVPFFSKYVEETLSQDNGVFIEVIGAGDKNGFVEGQPLSVAMRDSARCTRTGNAIYPVIYDDVDGKRYKLHFSRVMFSSQMTSPIAEMFGVGFCAVSRAVNVAQTLVDILVYKQEKLGSRPHRQIIITKGGLDPNDMKSAFELAENQTDAMGLRRYSKVVIGGSSAIPEAGVDTIELSSMPDGFNEETSITLGMATIALAFGVDARELFPSMGAGATRADALLSHLKQRGKGPGQILQTTEQLFNYKFLPSGFKLHFDFQDDAEDRQRAEIRNIRASRRTQDINSGAVTERILREQMIEDGEATQEQFDRMEIESGRLPDGDSIMTLFLSKDKDMKKFLKLGVDDPLDIKNNNPDEMADAIHKQRLETMDAIINARSEGERWKARMADSALIHLELLYMPVMVTDDKKAPGSPTANNANRIDTRTRTENPGRPTSEDTNQDGMTEDDTTSSGAEGQ